MNTAKGLSDHVTKTTMHEDRIQKLDRVFYVRWTSGPDYERAFLCVEDGEPDMRDFATVSFGQAELFVAAFEASRQIASSGKLESDDLVSTLIGRAKFCADHGEVKTPKLLQQAAGEISRLRSALADAERERDELRAAKWKQQHVDTMNDMASLGLALESAEAKLAEAVKVIEPFAKTPYASASAEFADDVGICDGVTLGDLRAARNFIFSMKGDES